MILHVRERILWRCIPTVPLREPNDRRVTKGQQVSKTPATNPATALRLTQDYFGAEASPYFSLSEFIKRRPSNPAVPRREILAIASGIDATVTHIDRGTKTLTVKTGSGAEETYRLTESAAKDAGKGIDEGTEKSAQVTVYYTGEAGHKVAHFFKKAI
jgi:hypothetical protein